MATGSRRCALASRSATSATRPPAPSPRKFPRAPAKVVLNAVSASSKLARFGFCLAAVSGVIFVGFRLAHVNATTAALVLLLVVLGVATRWGLSEAIATSVVAMLGFNFFFLPPIGTLTIADPENWIALAAFLVTAVTSSQLSSQARRRAEEAEAGRRQMGKLYELSRAMLMDEARNALAQSVSSARQILALDSVAFYDVAAAQMYGSTGNSGITPDDLARIATSGEPAAVGVFSMMPVRLGASVVGALAASGPTLTPALLDSLAGLLAINYERVRALDRAAEAEAARRNEEFKSSLLDGLAHDLKTPLTAIRSCITRLIDIPPRTEEVRRELLSIVDQESRRLEQSITEAVELARIESRELKLHREDASVADLIGMALAQSREENPQRFIVSVPADLRLSADGDLIRRALLQILENAQKYAPPDSPIEIAAARQDGQLSITISDHGPGIGRDELERVFEKFYRGRRVKAKTEGTGMRLAIARGIIEAHGGRIRASNDPRGGAVISITLPLAQGLHE